jgi:5-deoxy-D-glucuronate isomerase
MGDRLRHPVQTYWYWHLFTRHGMPAKTFRKAIDTEVYVSRNHRWRLPAVGRDELLTAARWSERDAKRVTNAPRKGRSREVRGRQSARAAVLLRRWADMVPEGKRVRELPIRKRYKIYQEAALWRTTGLS